MHVACAHPAHALLEIANALGVPIAAGLLYPVFGLLLSPTIAALAMILSSVSVVTNALRPAKTPLRPVSPAVGPAGRAS